MSDQQPKKRAGRPPNPERANVSERSTFSIRLRGSIRAKLIEESTRSGRSISEEIESRLESSFEEDRRRSNLSDGQKLAVRAVERCWEFFEMKVGSNEWSDFESGRAAMRTAMLQTVDFMFPALPVEKMTPHDRAELEQLQTISDEVVDMITWRHKDPQKAFPNNKLLQAGNGPISAVEAHNRWRKNQKAGSQ